MVETASWQARCDRVTKLLADKLVVKNNL